MLFKTRLGEILAEQNLKQADLCRMTGISTSLMSNYITGKASPSLDNAETIAKALGITLDYLVGREQSFLHLSKAKTALLDDYDSLNKEGQNLIMGILGSLRMTHAKQNQLSAGVVQSNQNGNNYYGISGGNFNSTVTIG